MMRNLFGRRGVLGAAMAGLGAMCCRAHAADTPPQVSVPGEPKSAKSRLLEHGADLLQRKHPLSAINMYLDGFHFYADDMGRQVEAHHYCTHLTEDLHQCVIFDSNGDHARLIGIEYIVSERLFRELPADEKPLWHSHRYEVKSGLLVMPGIPGRIEREAMESLVTTYGKTWHTWQVDRGDRLPFGIPQLMMGFTQDDQVDASKVQDRDRRFGISSADLRRDRQAIPMPTVEQAADAWQGGRTPQLRQQVVDVRNRR